ncbi:N-formylglutamate amidohydrolase [Iodidimonas sp. SYSU 1G8]|uniref:N-formylglutamate amidohydrolase n=1 Tax=Iodidimonas sp. SYSU 1G8 TaxID=3133967 RepID=UPI0031FEA074
MTPSEPALKTLDAAPDTALPACVVAEPARQTLPLVFSSPHSGRHYPADFIAASQLDPHTLRASEDAYVDELFAAAPGHGAPLLQAVYARAYLDVNREAWELDPDMFDGPLPDFVNARSGRVAAGLGTIARVVASGTAIYRDRLPFTEAERRVAMVYTPYHQTLSRLLERTRDQFGCAVLIDCHSMPSSGASWGDMPLKTGGPAPDFILGDRYGRSCSMEVVAAAQEALSGEGYRVVRNDPYSGGYNTRHYGVPREGRHALQIEISRALYMDETTMGRADGFDRLRDAIGVLINALSRLPLDVLRPL